MMLKRLVAAARMLRPRVIAETSREVARTSRNTERLRADVRDLQRVQESGQARHSEALLRIERQLAGLQEADRAQHERLESRLTSLGREVSELRLRESQLRAVAQRDVELERRLPQLADVLDEPSTATHVRDRVAAAPLHLHPFPYTIVDDLLPRRLYEALLEGIPPAELFADRPFNKRQVGVPLTMGPLYSRRVWHFMGKTVAPRMMTPPVLEKFRKPLDMWLEANLVPGALAILEQMRMACTDGRILLRGRGYHIPPHRDPKWGFITCILYLARASDDSGLGTQLYSVDADGEASHAKPHWIPADRCRLEATVEFRPNRALIFLNSTGAHGAQIPADAPESLERYLYQFRIGPQREQIRTLLAALPEDRRSAWEGKVTDY